MYFAHLSAAFGLLFALATAAIVASPGSGSFFPGGMLITALCVSPYVLLVLAAWFARYPCVKIGSFVVLMLTGTYCTLGYADYSFAIWTKPSMDAQSALIFVALPMFQNFVSVLSVVFLFALGAWLERRKQKGADSSGGPQENDASR
jgi:hypothetical protein